MKKINLLFIVLSIFLYSNDLINKIGIVEDKSERLQGIDKNHNRIRDDIEKELKKRYSMNERSFIAMSNLAKIDDVLFEANEMMDINALDNFLIVRQKLLLCIKAVLDSPNISSYENGQFSIDRYELQLKNTAEREKVFENIKEHFSENIIFDIPEKSCADNHINIKY